jgi:hypothetical protein
MTKSVKWTIQKIWSNSTVFILGGGKSLNTTGLDWNTEENKIKIRESISENLTCIHDKRVIGVNNAFELGDWVDVCLFGDVRWLEWNRRKLVNYAGLMVCCHPSMNESWIKTVVRDSGFGISKTPDKVFWNKSSGGAAINLAVHLGAKNIVLLGFDMFVEPNSKPNWHDEHEVNIDKKEAPYKAMLEAFPVIKEDADKLGVRIINTSLDSEINCFEKMTLQQAMEELCYK